MTSNRARWTWCISPAILAAMLSSSGCGSCGGSSSPGKPDEPEPPGEVLLSRLTATPSSVSFTHPDDQAALTVTGDFTNSVPEDLTDDPELTFDFDPPGLAGLTASHVLVPLADGSATLTIAKGAVQTTVAIAVDICKPRAPVLDASTVFAFRGTAHVSGQAPGADRVRLSMPHGALDLVVTGGQFAADVPVTAGTDDRSETWSAIAVRDACPETSAAGFLHVHEDQRAPTLAIAEPRTHASFLSPSIDVIGSVHDSGSGADSLRVTVNGAPAQLRAGIGPETSFVARGVSLAGGANTVTVSAMDAAGNTATQTLEVFLAPPGGPALAVAGGNAQEAEVMKVLPAPLTVRVTDATGQPVPGKLVTFSIAHSDGQLGANASSPNVRVVQSRTGPDGIAAARWQLGSAAGLGNNVVEARATGVNNAVRFWASALPGPPIAIGVVDSMPHTAEAGGILNERPRVWVNDGCNGVAGVSVRFSVSDGNGRVGDSQGNGSFHGATQVTLLTDVSGYAEVDFALGPEAGKQTLTAALVDHPEVAPATLEALALTRRSDATTGFTGRVVSDSDEALGVATITLAAGGQQATTRTAADGSFAFTDVPAAGIGILTIDGTTVTSDGGHPIAVNSYPVLTYDVNVVSHADNDLGRPIFLPELRAGNSAAYSLTQPTVLTMAGMPGMQLTIAPGSMKLASGAVAPNGTKVSLNPVDPNRIPMPLPSGAANPFAWTLQPSGARFDPPVQIQVPNTGGLAPGTQVSFFTFDHDLNRFEMVARGAVAEDGGTAVSDPGTGITKAGWGGLCPPYSLLGDFGSCGGLLTRAFWGNVLKLGAQVALLVTHAEEVAKCITGIGTAVIDYRTAGNTCKKALAAAQGVKDFVGNCTPFVPGKEAAELAEKVGSVADIVKTATDVIDKSMCLKEDGLLATANSTIAVAAAGVKAGADLAAGLINDNVKFGGLSAAMSFVDNVACPQKDSDEEAEKTRQEIDRNMARVRTLFDAFQMDFTALQSRIIAYNDLVTPWAADAGKVFAALAHPELAGFEVSAGGQSAVVDVTGGFVLRNIVAPDNFGADGPGSPRDLLSDNLIRIVGTRVINGVRQWIYSAFFQLAANRTTIVPDFTFSTTPPPEPDSLSLTLAISPPPSPPQPGPRAPITVFTAAGQTGQLTATAALTDGTSASVTPATGGTTYRTSNLAIATVSRDGLVTARGNGTAYITTSNGGVSSTIPVVVALGDPLTRVEGRVVRVDGSAAPGATVTTSAISGTSAADGSFALDGVPTVLGNITVAGRLGAASGSSLPQPPHPGLVTDVGDVVLGRRDSLGTEFLVLFESNLGATTLTLFLSGPVATTGVVEIGSLAFTMPFSVVPGQVTSLTVPAGAANATSDTVGRLAVHVTADQEIAVYGLNAAPFTTDAFAATPVDVLGTRYRVMSWPGSGNGPSQFEIGAVADGTTVTITPTATVGTRTLGVPYTVTLNALDTYQLAATTGDLTGTLIEASAPIAVFSGHRCANVPTPTTSACDHLTEQMPPVALWGSELLTVPLATRKNGDLFRIVADRDATQVTIDGPSPSTATLAAGQVLQVPLTAGSRISATAPILVAQYANSEGFDGVLGDPMMMMVIPATQFARGYTFTTPSTGFATNFINLVAPAEEAALGTVLLDGKPVAAQLFAALPNSAYSAAQVPLTAGAHVVSAPAPIGLYVYGFASFNAYGYPGGFSVSSP